MPMLPSLNDVAAGAAPDQDRRPTVVAAPAAASPELPDRPRRRIFAAADKLRILAETDRAADTGGINAILRREGLYSSALTDWRRQRAAGVFDALTPARRGRKTTAPNPLAAEMAGLQRDNARLTRRLARAEAIIEVQKKLGWQSWLRWGVEGAVIGGSWRCEMARTSARERPERECVLQPEQKLCPVCGAFMRIRYENDRTLVTLTGAVRLRLKIRRCETEGCMRHHHPYRPEAEGAVALAGHEFGLDVMALVGVLRHRDHRSVPEIHQVLRERGVAIAERSVTNLLDRYDELLATSLTDTRRLRRRPSRGG